MRIWRMTLQCSFRKKLSHQEGGSLAVRKRPRLRRTLSLSFFSSPEPQRATEPVTIEVPVSSPSPRPGQPRDLRAANRFEGSQ